MDEALFREAEDAGLNASAPPQQLWSDGWLIRLSPGKAKRARCINAVAVARRPLAVKLDECAALYRDVGLPLLVRVTPFSEPSGLDDELARLGWGSFDDTRVMLLPDLAATLPDRDPNPARPGHGISVEGASATAFAEAIGQLRGSPPGQVAAHAQRLAASPVRCHGRVWRDAGRIVACGQFAREGRWVGLYDIAVAPGQRNRGLGRALCAELLREAQAQGARAAYLQVDAGNAPARAVYRRLGFSDAYAYHYRSPDPDAAH